MNVFALYIDREVFLVEMYCSCDIEKMDYFKNKTLYNIQVKQI